MESKGENTDAQPIHLEPAFEDETWKQAKHRDHNAYTRTTARKNLGCVGKKATSRRHISRCAKSFVY